MKRIMKLNYLVALLFTATNIFAFSNPIINLGEGKTITVDLNDWRNSELEITIKDDNGLTLYEEELSKGEKEFRKYNLINLPAGKYYIEIESANKMAYHTITIEDNDMISDTVKEMIVFKPQFVIGENTIELNHLALGENVQVSIFDNNGVFYTKTYKDISSINTRFDISSLPKGEYSISLTSRNQYVTQSFGK